METQDEKDVLLTPGQKLATSISSGIILALLGVFLLITGLNILPFGMRLAMIPAGLIAVGLIFVIAAFIQDNVVALWVGSLLIAVASVSILAPATSLGYRRLYPMYMLAPAIASIITMIYSKEVKDHIKAILFFGVLSGFFFLNSFGIADWVVVLPIMLLSFGAFIILLSLIVRRRIKGEIDNA